MQKRDRDRKKRIYLSSKCLVLILLVVSHAKTCCYLTAYTHLLSLGKRSGLRDKRNIMDDVGVYTQFMRDSFMDTTTTAATTTIILIIIIVMNITISRDYFSCYYIIFGFSPLRRLDRGGLLFNSFILCNRITYCQEILERFRCTHARFTKKSYIRKKIPMFYNFAHKYAQVHFENQHHVPAYFLFVLRAYLECSNCDGQR